MCSKSSMLVRRQVQAGPLKELADGILENPAAVKKPCLLAELVVELFMKLDC